MIDEINSYATAHGIAASTAIGRLLLEGHKAKTGKPITRFAALDPQATKYYSLALGQLREINDTLRHTIVSLNAPRPMVASEEGARDTAFKQVAEASAAVKPAIDSLKKAGHLEFLLTDVDPGQLNRGYEKAVEMRYRTNTAVYGALLGRPTELPAQPASRPQPSSTPSAPTSAQKSVPEPAMAAQRPITPNPTTQPQNVVQNQNPPPKPFQILKSDQPPANPTPHRSLMEIFSPNAKPNTEAPKPANTK